MMKPNKALGQHFLNDLEVAESVAESIENAAVMGSVLEVGPGLGVLTNFLYSRYSGKLHLVEYDRRFIEKLKTDFPIISERIYYGDFLDFDLSKIPAPIALVGNFPYNISSQILFRALDFHALVPQITGMFQKEMARRVASKECSREYGIISVLIQCYYEVHYLFDVPPSSFSPPPNVMSGVIHLKRRENPLIPLMYQREFKMIVKTGFNQRRKTMRNSLRSLFRTNDNMTDPLFDKRPEQLSVEAFLPLCERLKDLEENLKE